MQQQQHQHQHQNQQMSQYRNYPPYAAAAHHLVPQQQQHQQQQRPMPHAARRPTVSRGSQPGPPPVAPNQREVQYRMVEEQKRAHQKAITRSQTPTDRDLPPGIEDLVIGDGVQRYHKLREVERRLDATMMRKRLDIQDSVTRGSKKYGIMRIWVSNTVEHQPWQTSGMDPEAFDFTSPVEASFRVKIEGRLLESENADEEVESDENDKPTDHSEADSSKPAANEPTKTASQADDPEGERAAKRPRLALMASGPTPVGRKRFSRFFKNITIDFDRSQSLQPDGYTRIEWIRPDQTPDSSTDLPKNADFDTLEFERKSDENINITINLTLDEQPERYRLAPPLAQLLDVEEADRTTVLLGLWEYIRMAGLQGDEDSRRIMCDERLREIFKTDALNFPHLPEMIKPLLFDPPPVSLPYTIRVDKAFHTNEGAPVPTIYDIRVPVEDPLLTQLKQQMQSGSHAPTLQAIAQKDKELALLIQHLNHSKAKHGFFSAMGNDPVNFVKRWTSSQKRDLDVIMGAGVWGEEDWQTAEWRKGGVDGPWGTDEAWEGVGLYLSARSRP